MGNILLWSLIFHELGHYLYLRYIVKDKNSFIVWQPLLDLGTPYNEKKLRPRQKALLFFSGIMLGLLPIVIGIIVYAVYVWWVLPFYTMACIYDIKQLVQADKKVRGKKQ